MPSLTITSVVSSTLLFILANALDVPTGWRKPNITISLDDRKELAYTAVQKAVEMLDDNLTTSGSVDTTATLYALLPRLDFAANQTKYVDKMRQFFTRYPRSIDMAKLLQDTTSSVKNDLMFGLAAVWAYTTYRDPQFLSVAQDAWFSARNYTLLSGDVASGNMAVHVDYNVLQQQCPGGAVNMTGGTSGPNELDYFKSFNTGKFFSLSAFLYQASSDRRYLSAAMETAGFFQTVLYRPPGLFLDRINNQNCTPGTTFEITASGYWIEGIALIVALTGDTSLLTLMEQTVVAATKYTGTWQRDDGVQENDLHPFSNADLVRGLTTAYSQLNSSSELKNYIRLYIGVQYNSIRDSATVGNSNTYSRNWAGPWSSTPDPKSQAAASVVLTAGLTIFDPEPDSLIPSALEIGKEPVGPIIGGVLGGLIFIIGIIAASVIYHRRRGRPNTDILSPTPFRAYRRPAREMRTGALALPQKRGATRIALSTPPMEPSGSGATADNRRGTEHVDIDELARKVYQRMYSETPPSYRSN